MTICGELQDISIEQEIEWKILNFSLLSCENGIKYKSSPFSFAKESWCLCMCPNGEESDSKGYVSLFLYKISSGCPIKLKCSLGLKTLNGVKYEEEHFTCTYETECGYGFPKFLSRDKLFEKKSDLLPVDVITMFCNLKFPVSDEASTSLEDSATAKCSYCEKLVDAESLSRHQKKDKPMKCPDCSAIFTIESWCDHKCQAQKNHDTDYLVQSSKILEDFKELFLQQKECDVVIKVKDQEFSAHRAILIARSSVFESTFRNDMKEKATGFINIEDCDPSSFSDFLHFLYCGDSDNISEGNVFNLFVTADKYDVKDLKLKCTEFIKCNLSVDIFCDAIALALKYSETELIKLATDFFAKNLQKIIMTVEWQSFLADNPTQSNELLIKALVTDKNSAV